MCSAAFTSPLSCSSVSCCFRSRSVSATASAGGTGSRRALQSRSFATCASAAAPSSGAGNVFVDYPFAAMGGNPTAAGRPIVLASFLLGGPSGSGVATTVTLGSVAYPMLDKAGYGKDAAGGLLAGGGLGAIISPPVLGAAAFLIAEFLKISYLDVLLMATIPTLLC